MIASADSTGANPTATVYLSFTTKTDLAVVSITNLSDTEVVSSIGDIIVTASDTAHARFSSYGIINVELDIDGLSVDSYDVTPASNAVTYTFHAGALGIGPGVHVIEVTATDDFWAQAYERIQVVVHSSGATVLYVAPISVCGNNPVVVITEIHRGAEVGSTPASLSYTAGPYKYGSKGTLSLKVSTGQGVKTHSWPAQSGQYLGLDKSQWHDAAWQLAHCNNLES